MPNNPYRPPLVDICADDAEIGRYAALLDSLSIGLLVFAADGSLQSRNTHASTLLGTTPTIWEDENGDELSADDHLEVQVLRTRRPERQRALGIRKDASTPLIRCSASAFPVLAEDGSLRCVLLTLANLSQPHAGSGAQRTTHAPLSGVISEVDILLMLDDEGRRARRYGTPFAIALLGVDHFPELCAANGALAGERMLADVGQLLCTGLREFDVVGHFRADLFLLILPNVRVNEAVIGLERLRELVETTHAADATGPLTISGGVSEFTGEDSAALIESVRSLLAAARDTGGNQLCVNLDFF